MAARNIFPGHSLIKKLGNGGFGHVFKATRDADGEEVAIKIVTVPELVSAQMLPDAYKETVIHIALSGHQNIVTMIQSATIQDPVSKSHYVLTCMELCSDNLLVAMDKKGIDLPHMKKVIKDITTGLAYMHRLGYVHRDLKTENILLSRDGIAKIADFGCSAAAKDLTFGCHEVGTIRIRAPEMVLGCPSHGPEMDLWSLGVLVFELFYNKPLNLGGTFQDVISNLVILHGELTPRTIPGCQNFKNYASVARLISDMMTSHVAIDDNGVTNVIHKEPQFPTMVQQCCPCLEVSSLILGWTELNPKMRISAKHALMRHPVFKN